MVETAEIPQIKKTWSHFGMKVLRDIIQCDKVVFSYTMKKKILYNIP